jgi:curved DNA-binding protein CbpA
MHLSFRRVCAEEQRGGEARPRAGGVMPSSVGGTDGDRRCPRLAPDWEEHASSLTPAEGFLLSRIDGHTPWAVLREIGGLSPGSADAALASWVHAGLVLLDSDKPDAPPAREAEICAAALDASLDLPVELQREILAFEARLAGATHHEILGVERSSDPREIKRAYFRLSKRFHPDRYFRRSIGDYAARLDRIFRHVALAYELLSDPTTRTEIERAMAPPPEADAGAHRATGGTREVPAEPPPAAPGYRAPSRMENLERLRNSFKIPAKMLTERRSKARQLHDSARVAAHEKRWLEAAASARLAIAFDPFAPEYQQHFASIQADVHAARATELLEQADGTGAKADALRLLEEAIHYRPADAALQARAAALALEVGDLEHAREFAESARELEPNVLRHAVILSRVHRRQGDAAAARETLLEAAALDPSDPDVLAEQRRLRMK